MKKVTDLSRFIYSRIGRKLFLFGFVTFSLTISVYTATVQVENNDAFCASCHTEPESAYYQDSLAPDNSDILAAFHTGLGTRCIDCHSRQWIPGRVWAQWGGLQNLLAFHSGDYADPSATTRPVGEGGCTKCHSDLTWVSQRPSHYHSPQLRRNWRAAGGPANSCQACHPSHTPVSRFADAARNESECTACHDATG